MNILKFLLFPMILTFFFNQDAKKELYGKWQLVKVETNNETLIPGMDFFLTISEKGLGFNRDVNGCSAEARITATSIDYDSELCTRVCCDGSHDPIGGMNIYRGNYVVSRNSLIIENEQVKTYLIRIRNER